MNRFRSLAVLLCAAMLTSCEKNGIQELMTSAPGARIKFFNYGVNAPGVNFYANDAKMTAIGSATGTEAVIGTAYGSAGSGGFYSGVAPGQYTLTGRIAAATDKDVAISKLAASLADGKFYSYYQSGFYSTTTKTVDAFIVEDSFVAEIDYSVAYVRFVNAISNANPMTLYVKNRASGSEVTVGAAVPYKGAGAFVAVPNGVYDLSTRYTGVATNAISRAEVSLSAGLVYTIGARGDITVTSTTAATRPILETSQNR